MLRRRKYFINKYTLLLENTILGIVSVLQEFHLKSLITEN